MTDARAGGRHAAAHFAGESEPLEVIRREERLRIGIERVATERVRIERYIVTEQQTFTVEVSHEELRVIREPLDPEVERAVLPAAPRADSLDLVITLHREEVLVSKRVVPSELARVRVVSVAGEQRIVEELRREEVDVTSAPRPDRPLHDRN